MRKLFGLLVVALVMLTGCSKDGVNSWKGTYNISGSLNGSMCNTELDSYCGEPTYELDKMIEDFTVEIKKGDGDSLSIDISNQSGTIVINDIHAGLHPSWENTLVIGRSGTGGSFFVDNGLINRNEQGYSSLQVSFWGGHNDYKEYYDMTFSSLSFTTESN